MSDTVYNNPSKGRAMNQSGTQCSSPLVECETTKNMVLGISTLNRLFIMELNATSYIPVIKPM